MDALLPAVFLLAATAASTTRSAARLEVRAAAFPPGGTIPKKHTCDGEDVSPAFSWSGAPQGTKEFVFFCEDPDAPGGTFVHWVLWEIPSHRDGVPEGIAAGDSVDSLGGAHQGTNGFRVRGYRGPCPPPGKPHHYHFRVAALDSRLDLPAGTSIERVREAMGPHVLAQGETVGVYGR